MKHEKVINRQRQRRRFRNRNAMKAVSTRARMSIFRSCKNVYVQIIDDEEGKTLVSAGSLDKDLREQISYGGNCDAAKVVGKAIAEKALAAGVKSVAFDRREYKYHGRVAALADAARDAGLDLGAKAVVPEKAPKKDSKSKKKQKQKKK